MSLTVGSAHSDAPNTNQMQRKESSNVVRKSANFHPSVWGDRFLTISLDDLRKESSKEVRKSANFHPSVWGDRFLTISLDDLKPDAYTQQRADRLKEEVKRMLNDVHDLVEELNMIDAIQRLGVAYHFEKEIEAAILKMYNTYNDGMIDTNNLKAIALQFRLLRQEGYCVSPNVFYKFKDDSGSFRKTLESDIRGLLSLYEAAHLGIKGEDILDEAIIFTKEHLMLAHPNLKSPLSTLVELALELPLRKRVERLQSRLYISIYQEEEEHNDVILEFAKLDFNLLQLLHKKELREISMWWKEKDFVAKLPFIRDRVVECYFWILGVYFEPHYSRARMITTRIISLISAMDDIYDVYGTLEELEPFTDAIQRWDRSAADQLPDYMKFYFIALLEVVDKIEEELAKDGKSYFISYLKEALKEVSKYYYDEAEWFHSGYVPTLSEYMKIALVTSGYPSLCVVSIVGMGEMVTKEALEWAINKPDIIKACSVMSRFKDDIQSNQFEQERGHVASSIQLYMDENGSSYKEACEKLRGLVVDAWKDINKACFKPTQVPMTYLTRVINFARVAEVIYQNRDGYTDSTQEIKQFIISVLVNPVSL